MSKFNLKFYKNRCFGIILIILTYNIIVSGQLKTLEYDGVYVENKSGVYTILKNSKAYVGHYVTSSNMLKAFWHFPKKVFTPEDNRVKVTSVASFILKGDEFNGSNISYVELFEIEEIKLNMGRFFRNGDTIWENGLAFRSKEDENGKPLKIEFLRKKVEDKYIIYPKISLETKKLYGLFTGKDYYLIQM